MFVGMETIQPGTTRVPDDSLAKRVHDLENPQCNYREELREILMMLRLPQNRASICKGEGLDELFRIIDQRWDKIFGAKALPTLVDPPRPEKRIDVA